MSKNNKRPSFTYETDPGSPFGMITNDLLRSKAFQELSRTAQVFYIVCVAHKSDSTQSTALYKALQYYYAGIENKTDEDAKLDSGQNKKTITHSTKFVFPEKQLEEYGFSSQSGSKYKKELIDKGFLKIAHQDKPHMMDGTWTRVPTVYEFTNKWKKDPDK